MNRISLWMFKYRLLEKYYYEHGNIDVPAFYEVDGIKLGDWVSTLRSTYSGVGRGKMNQYQVELLNKLGMDWNVKDTKVLNNVIKTKNRDRYNLIMLNRLKHILEDLVFEGFNEIDEYETQKEIEDIVVKRLWK